MSRLTALCLSSVLVIATSSAWAQSSNELKLGTETASRGSLASVALTLTSTDEVEGLVASFEWNGAVGTGEDLVSGDALSTADTVVARVEDRYMVLGVVVDSNGEGPSVIPPGSDILLATVRIRAADVDEETSTELTFVDGKYNTVDGGPLLDNLVTVGGLSITQGEGLHVTGGHLTVVPVEPSFAFKIQNGSSSDESECGATRVLLDSNAPVEGYEVALGHPAGLLLESIAMGAAAEANGADFWDTEILSNGGVIGVVMDLVEPFEDNVIPPGEDLEIAVFTYCCSSRPQPPAGALDYTLSFVDGVLGTPAKDNTVVSGGLSFAPELNDGKYTCTPHVDRETICDDGIDNDNDGLIDCDDPDCYADPACPGPVLACGAQEVGDDDTLGSVSGAPGETAEVCLFYKAEDALQGISIAICTSCDMPAKPGTFDVTGTIVEAVGADYIKEQVDSDPDDGDGCELIIGILMDSAPPFDGATLPPTDTYLRIGCVDFEIADDPALSGQCLAVTFCDGANGTGKIPIRNLVSIDNQSVPARLGSCDVCIRQDSVFYRGDCNFSNEGQFAVDIADAAAGVSYLLEQGDKRFEPPCLDACDCNDDGRIDLADVMCVLRYLFEMGPMPPAPGPGLRETGLPNPDQVEEAPSGIDPTPDLLDCKGTTVS